MSPKSNPTLAEARVTAGGDGMRRICGIHVEHDGQVAAVWLSHDKDVDRVHLYDCVKHEREVLAVQAESIKRRGAWIPVAWNEGAKEIADRLLEHGVNIIPESVKNKDQLAEATALEIWERMRTGRFRVKETLQDWLDEFSTYQRQDGSVPLDTHPLMNATRHAIANLEWARTNTRKAIKYPKVAMV